MPKGLLFCILAFLPQNIIFIPAILTMGVSSIKLYNTIIGDRRKENIKSQIIAHSIMSIIMLILIIFSCIVESEISLKLLKFGIKWM